MGLEIPEDYGGAHGTFFQSLLVIEEISRVDPSVAIVVDIQNTLINRLISQLGTEDQKAKYLPKLAQDTIGSFCLSEPGSGSDAFAMKTKAEKKGTLAFFLKSFHHFNE
jgi:alkylation response protein AidB-like acyl-CoA dehydrogenase